MLLDTHGENIHTHGTSTQSKQRETDEQTPSQHTHRGRISGGKCLTQFDVLIISEDQDDVGSHVAEVAVPLQARPLAVSRQVARAMDHRKHFHHDKKEDKKKRKRGRENPPCHLVTLQSPPQSSVLSTWRRNRDRESVKNKIHTHTHKHGKK